MEHFARVVALTRMVSAVFRRGGDVAFVAGELEAIFDPRGGQWCEGKYVPSLIATVGGILERHMIATAHLELPEPASDIQNRPQKRTSPASACSARTAVSLAWSRKVPA